MSFNGWIGSIQQALSEAESLWDTKGATAQSHTPTRTARANFVFHAISTGTNANIALPECLFLAMVTGRYDTRLAPINIQGCSTESVTAILEYT